MDIPEPPVAAATAAVSILQSASVSAVPAPGDYDGDGKTDMALKDDTGVWYIDLAANGFGGRWDLAYAGYGGDNAVPVPADYDGDGKTDLAVKDAWGMWAIDYASNGFGTWDVEYFGYGNADAVPVPADYDGDGKADLAVKTGTGDWYIDMSSNGFGSWDVHVSGYGNSSVVPVPADYDGDGKADISVKDSAGCWYIDYANNGFGAWNEIHCGYGNANAVPVPFDYDHDGKTDLAVKDGAGTWLIDYASNGFGGWGAAFCCLGAAAGFGLPGDYDGDGAVDLASYNNATGFWDIDKASNGYAGRDLVVSNPDRQLVNFLKPYIYSTEIDSPAGQTSVLTVGAPYILDVVLQPGLSDAENAQAGLELNPDLHVPAALAITDGHRFQPVRFQRCSTDAGCGAVNQGVGDCNQTTGICNVHRRYAITCKQPGNFPLGFELRNTPINFGGTESFNPDYGIRVVCTDNSHVGLYGRVSARALDPNGVYINGAPIAGATVTWGSQSTTTLQDGSWAFPTATGGPHTVSVTAPGHAPAKAVNLNVPPGSGIEIDTPLEEDFHVTTGGAVSYTTYIDYSRGRTLFHVAEIVPGSATVSTARSTLLQLLPIKDACESAYVPGLVTQTSPVFDTLLHIATNNNAAAVMNGIWWDPCNGVALGYFYSNGVVQAEAWCENGIKEPQGSSAACTGSVVYNNEAGGTLFPQNMMPMFTISGLARGQQFGIAQSHDNFYEFPSTQWTPTTDPMRPAIWDVSPRDNISDVSFALQIGNPPLLWQGAVIAGGDFAWSSVPYYDFAFARTSIGILPSGHLLLVVADGEGIMGGSGATANQLARLYRDSLGATAAMGLDSGLSTEMILHGASGPRRVNTLTGEDATIQINPYREILPELKGTFGSVANYVMVKP